MSIFPQWQTYQNSIAYCTFQLSHVTCQFDILNAIWPVTMVVGDIQLTRGHTRWILCSKSRLWNGCWKLSTFSTSSIPLFSSSTTLISVVDCMTSISPLHIIFLGFVPPYSTRCITRITSIKNIHVKPHDTAYLSWCMQVTTAGIFKRIGVRIITRTTSMFLSTLNS